MVHARAVEALAHILANPGTDAQKVMRKALRAQYRPRKSLVYDGSSSDRWPGAEPPTNTERGAIADAVLASEVNRILVEDRLQSLVAFRDGFDRVLEAVSAPASRDAISWRDACGALTPKELRQTLCGDETVTAASIGVDPFASERYFERRVPPAEKPMPNMGLLCAGRAADWIAEIISGMSRHESAEPIRALVSGATSPR